MRVLIFTEGGGDIGLGHLYRCLALYDQARTYQLNVNFVLNHGSKDLSIILDKRHVIYCDWYDLNSLESIVEKSDLCIIDSYIATYPVYDYIAKASFRTAYIDDYDRLDYPEGIVVKGALLFDNSRALDSKKLYLMGPRYVVLRQMFRNIQIRTVSKKVSRVLVTLGGSDVQALTPKVVACIKQVLDDVTIDVVIGKGYASELVKKINIIDDICVHRNLSGEEMYDLMCHTDFAICAAGQTVYELVALNVPFIPIRVIDNQDNNVKGILKYQLVHAVVDYNMIGYMNLITDEIRWITIYENRLKIVDKQKNIIDGNGPARIINELIKDVKDENKHSM